MSCHWRHFRRVLVRLLTASGFVASGLLQCRVANSDETGEFQEFREHATVASPGTFATDDLLQELRPDRAGGLCAAGTYLDGTFAGDARSSTDPGSMSPRFDSVPWPNTPGYLVYTLRRASDIAEIRITALAPAFDRTAEKDTRVAWGDLALGVSRQTNRDGALPVRPEENAIEVQVDGEEVWTPLVTGQIRSPEKKSSEGLFQYTCRPPAGPVRSVLRIKFALGQTRGTSNHGQLTRISEIDVVGTRSREPTAPFQFVPAADERIALTGFVFPEGSSRDAVLLRWSGSGFRCRFRSMVCRLRFSSGGGEYWIRVDGGPFKRYAVKSRIDLAAALASDRDVHEIEAFKKTESAYGMDGFLGCELSPSGEMLPSRLPDRRLLVLGDSISVGMKAGMNQDTDFRRTYGYLIAERLGADVRLIGRSGIGVHKGWHHIPFVRAWREVVRTSGRRTNEQTFAVWSPDLILIQLGTNDFSRKVEARDFLPAMGKLLGEIRKDCPESAIAVVVPWSSGCFRKGLRTLVSGLSREGFDNLHFFDASPETWIPEGGMADNTHPNGKGHRHAAEKLVPMVKKATGW